MTCYIPSIYHCYPIFSEDINFFGNIQLLVINLVVNSPVLHMFLSFNA